MAAEHTRVSTVNGRVPYTAVLRMHKIYHPYAYLCMITSDSSCSCCRAATFSGKRDRLAVRGEVWQARLPVGLRDRQKSTAAA